MYKLNEIDCGGYVPRSNRLIFTLHNTDPVTVAALDGQTLNYTDSEGELIAQFKGYELIGYEKQGTAIIATFMRKLDDATKASIEALETNLANLTQVTQASIMSLATVTDPVPSLLMRANLTDDEAVNYISVYPEYKVGFDYKQGWIFRYGEDLYRVGQDHTSQEQWVPGETGTESLYSKIEFTSGGYEIWQEYDGISGSYSNGQIVQDPTDNQLYISKIDSNVWGPPSTQPDYWELYTES